VACDYATQWSHERPQRAKHKRPAPCLPPHPAEQSAGFVPRRLLTEPCAVLVEELLHRQVGDPGDPPERRKTRRDLTPLVAHGVPVEARPCCELGL
jgi:hypothetical protein